MFTKAGPGRPRSSDRKLAEYLPVGEAAQFLGVSPWTLRNWDNAGKLETLRHPKNGYRIYRREDLEALLEHEGLRGRLYDRFPPQVDWSALGDTDHFVQFYENDAFLASTVSRFVGGALHDGEGVVLIATPRHRNAIRRSLRARGLDPSLARAHGQMVVLDAAETLGKFMVDGSPDPRRFRDVVGGVLARAGQGRPRLRAFGEMVALLWAAGRPAAAIRLEELWNELRDAHPFVLQCAYPMDGFKAVRHGAAFGDICDCHSRVIPAESYATLSTDPDRLQAIARLQQKAQALEAETARRKRLEATLRASRRQLPDKLKRLLARPE
jgi:hypothetical protein